MSQTFHSLSTGLVKYYSFLHCESQAQFDPSQMNRRYYSVQSTVFEIERFFVLVLHCGYQDHQKVHLILQLMTTAADLLVGVLGLRVC
jgi:hypothetical protein